MFLSRRVMVSQLIRPKPYICLRQRWFHRQERKLYSEIVWPQQREPENFFYRVKTSSFPPSCFVEVIFLSVLSSLSEVIKKGTHKTERRTTQRTLIFSFYSSPGRSLSNLIMELNRHILSTHKVRWTVLYNRTWDRNGRGKKPRHVRHHLPRCRAINSDNFVLLSINLSLEMNRERTWLCGRIRHILFAFALASLFFIDVNAIQVYRMTGKIRRARERFKIDDSNFDKDSMFVVFLSWVAHKRSKHHSVKWEECHEPRKKGFWNSKLHFQHWEGSLQPSRERKAAEKSFFECLQSLQFAGRKHSTICQVVYLPCCFFVVGRGKTIVSQKNQFADGK